MENLDRSLPNAQPCNFVSVSRKDSSIKGTWLLDPMLSIPSELLSPLPAGESESTRKNLSLQTKDGSINANIFVLADELQKTENKMNLRTLIDASTKDGDVTIKMVGSTCRRIWFYSCFLRSMKYLPRKAKFESQFSSVRTQATGASASISQDPFEVYSELKRSRARFVSRRPWNHP